MARSPPLALYLPSVHSSETDSCAAAASALSRSAEGGRPRLRRGTPGKDLRCDLSGASFVTLSLFRLPTLESRASVSPSMALLTPFLSVSLSASRVPSSPGGLSSSPAATWLPEFHAFLLLEDGGRPRLFSPLPGGLPGSRFTFSAGLSGPSGFACGPAGSNEGDGGLEAALCAVWTRGGRPLGFFSCIDGESKKRTGIIFLKVMTLQYSRRKAFIHSFTEPV